MTYSLSSLASIAIASAAEALMLRRQLASSVAPLPTNQLFLFLFLFQLGLWVLYRSVIYPTFFSVLRHLPTAPRRLPIIGYGPVQFANNRAAVLHAMTKAIPNSGLIRLQGFLDAEHLFLTTPETLTEVLVKRPYDFVKPPGLKKIMDHFLKDEVLLISEGDKHRAEKRAMQPPFNLRKTLGLYPMFWSKALDMIDIINSSSHRDAKGAAILDIGEHINRPIIEATFCAMFGDQFQDSPHKEELARLGESIVSPRWDVRVYFMLSTCMPFWTRFLIPGGVSTRINSASLRLEKAVTEMIEERRESAGQRVYNDIIIDLLETFRFTDSELVSNFVLFLIAGIEPIGAGVAWTLRFLAQYPEWQRRLRAEIHANIPYEYFENGPSCPRLEEAGSILENMALLDAVCNESLRLMPPLPTTNRVALRDTTIAGQPVPVGTKLFTSAYSANRLEALWGPDAETWDPDRWLRPLTDQAGAAGTPVRPGVPKGLHTGAATGTNVGFLSFNHGPRKCIGHIYSQAKIRAFLAAIVGRFEFELAAKERHIFPVGILVSKPSEGLDFVFRPVQPW